MYPSGSWAGDLDAPIMIMPVGLRGGGMLDEWCAYLAATGASEGTVRQRLHYARRYLATVPDPWTASLDDVARFLSHPGWAPETRKGARASLRSLYHWGLASGRTSHDPTARMPAVRVPPPSARPVPELVLVDAMLNADEPALLMILLAAYAGLRLAEIARVHSRDVGPDGLRVTGKGGRVRVVPIHEYLAPRLGALDGWAFPSTVRPGQHVTPDHVHRRVTALLEPPWTTHTLRHRFATRAYAATRDIRAVQTLLGHSSVATTQRYVATSYDDLVAAVNAVA